MVETQRYRRFLRPESPFILSMGHWDSFLKRYYRDGIIGRGLLPYFFEPHDREEIERALLRWDRQLPVHRIELPCSDVTTLSKQNVNSVLVSIELTEGTNDVTFFLLVTRAWVTFDTSEEAVLWKLKNG